MYVRGPRLKYRDGRMCCVSIKNKCVSNTKGRCVCVQDRRGEESTDVVYE